RINKSSNSAADSPFALLPTRRKRLVTSARIRCRSAPEASPMRPSSRPITFCGRVPKATSGGRDIFPGGWADGTDGRLRSFSGPVIADKASGRSNQTHYGRRGVPVPLTIGAPPRPDWNAGLPCFCRLRGIGSNGIHTARQHWRLEDKAMGGLSIWHWIIVIGVVLLLLGRGKIFELIGHAAQGLKAFKKGMSEDEAKADTPAAAAKADPKIIDHQ